LIPRSWRESVSLRHFQSCNVLIINHFLNYGVEDELKALLCLRDVQGLKPPVYKPTRSGCKVFRILGIPFSGPAV
jgi:hypothetical protein